MGINILSSLAPNVTGQGVPAGGTASQVLSKVDAVDYNMEWSDVAISGGTGDLLSTLTASEISVTGAVTATIGRMHVCSGTSADYTVTLPAASGNAGKLIGFRMASTLTKLVTVGTLVLWAGEACTLFCDGTAWCVIAAERKTLACKMRISTSQTFAVGTATLLALDTVVSEAGPTMASVAGNRIIAARDSTYSLRAGAEFNNTNTNTGLRLITSIYKNGARLVAETAFAPPSSYFQTVAHTVARLAKGDYIQTFVAFTVGAYTSPVVLAVVTSPSADSSLDVVEL